MAKMIVFRGASGAGYEFQQADVQKPWANQAGVAVFAAPDAYGWRVIRVVELSGRDHDVRAIWALHDAERYGASCVFVEGCAERAKRQAMIVDLEMGLSPVICNQRAEFAVAA